MRTLITTNIFFLLCLLPGVGWAQLLTISGYINDSSNGGALENVSIYETNSRIGTITNKNGFYRLVLADTLVNLKISNGGFKSIEKELKLNSDTILVVNLEPVFDDSKRQKKTQELRAEITPASKKNSKQKADLE